MNRRWFLKALAGGVGGIALAEAIPFNRVWFFPKVIKPVNLDLSGLASIYYDKNVLDKLKYAYWDITSGAVVSPVIQVSGLEARIVKGLIDEGYLFNSNTGIVEVMKDDGLGVTLNRQKMEPYYELRESHDTIRRLNADRPRGELHGVLGVGRGLAGAFE